MKLGIIDTDSIAPVRYDWGAVKWVVDNSVVGGSEQSFGVVHINPGQTNPAHWHTSAQEIVHMIQGECDIETASGTIKLQRRPDPVHPVGDHHELTNNGWEPAIYVCSFSASGRGTFFVDPDGPGATALSGATGRY